MINVPEYGCAVVRIKMRLLLIKFGLLTEIQYRLPEPLSISSLPVCARVFMGEIHKNKC